MSDSPFRLPQPGHVQLPVMATSYTPESYQLLRVEEFPQSCGGGG